MPIQNAGYREEQLKILEAALNRACEKLGIPDKEREAREQVAKSILALSQSGQLDVDQLIRYATDQCFSLRKINYSPPVSRSARGHLRNRASE